MQDYFIWNSTDCRRYSIHVTEQPPITIPAERRTQTNVPGRPGSLTQLEGDDVYDDLLLTATCFISDPTQIPRRMAEGGRHGDESGCQAKLAVFITYSTFQIALVHGIVGVSLQAENRYL